MAARKAPVARFPKWLVGVSTLVLLGFCSWVSVSIISLGAALAGQESTVTSVKESLSRIERRVERIEDKLDAILLLRKTP